MSPPKVPPGSDAAKAAAEVGQYIAAQGSGLELPALESYAKARMEAYGVDPVTSAASARTVTVMAERDPGNTRLLAESIVAKTVSDPATIGERIQDNVRRQVAERGGLASIGKSQQKALAYDEAEDALRRAGVTDTQSYADLRTRVHEYIDAGASPDVAASAAAAPALAQAGPQADSLSIFGYLVMLVHGDVKYVFKNTERLDVVGSVIHTHMKSTKYDMSDYNFHVKCDTIQTTSTNEFLNVRPHFGYGIGNYPGEYKSIATSSVSAYLLAGKAGMQWLTYGLYSLSGTKQRVYLAGIDNDVVMYNRGIKITNGDAADQRKTVLTIEKIGKGIERAITRMFK
ncbi:hypothetical protein [Bordetella sp. 2513F-2]